MRKLLTLLGTAFFLLLATVLIYLFTLPKFTEPSTEIIEANPEQLARGDYLFNAVLGCPVCHSERDYSQFGGPPVAPFGGGRACSDTGKPLPGLAESGGLPGTICFRNITPHETGIFDWTDGELLRAVREGIGKENQALFPIMPYFIYRNLSDEDAQSVVAYVRSLEAVDHSLPDTAINFPVNLAIRLLPDPLNSPVPQPDTNNPIAYGKYLSTVARCSFCHSPRDSRSRQAIEGLELAGGVEFQGHNGLMYSTNLTPHAEGLGEMSEAEFLALFRRTTDPSAADINLMPWTYYGNMSDADLSAIFAYLQSVPAVSYSP
ncbi:MAG: c-type cytochrome [Gammaproteobacteria bacterium]|nr:c-type cytochrome [Gammaproteobacteria bacterium]